MTHLTIQLHVFHPWYLQLWCLLTVFVLNFEIASAEVWPSGLTLGSRLTLRKIAFWLSKICRKLKKKFFLIAKNCHFFKKKLPKLCCCFLAIFKKDIFWQFKKKRREFLAIFWHSNGNFPEGQLIISFWVRNAYKMLDLIYPLTLISTIHNSVTCTPKHCNIKTLHWLAENMNTDNFQR